LTPLISQDSSSASSSASGLGVVGTKSSIPRTGRSSVTFSRNVSGSARSDSGSRAPLL
jgi:hypothetical protein